MSQIKSFKFDKNSFNEIRAYRFGKNWPVVYVLENGKDVYVGQAINAYRRLRQHNENIEKQILKLKTAHILSDDEFNVSAALDIESWLIQYMSADQVFTLHNKNGGLKNHNYYDRPKYKAKFEDIWKQFLEMGIAKSTLEDLKNTDLFKYSPYKSLTEDQLFVARKIFKDLKSGKSQSYIVNGKPGTGKTILATYLFKFLKEQDETKNLKMALVVPMTPLRTTIKKVFGKIKGLSSSMVIGPNDVARDSYDLLIVDEAHRLQRRKNIMGMGAYDQVNARLGFSKEATNLDWIMKCSKNQIFFYDENQSIKPADVRKEDFKNLNAKHYTLSTQMRIGGGENQIDAEDYLKFIENFFDLQKPNKTSFGSYDFKIYDNVEEMVSVIKEKDKKHGLSRVVAGYAWPWHTKSGSKSKQKYDIEIGDYKGIWNSTATDWVNSLNAINEVGCIHTVQGYDLNYVGVIIGPEFGYDIENKKFFVDREKYLDRNGRAGIQDPKELDDYIKNIYKTILTRGIKGTYIYIVDQNLREYFKRFIGLSKSSEIIKSPYLNINSFVSIPLVGSAPCGSPLMGEENIEEYIKVDKNKIKPGYQYFILRATGDSMNKAGINDGDLVLCKFGIKGETGDRVVALLGGENVTIKYYDKKDGRRILLPKSSNPIHKPIIPEEGDSVQGVVQEVIK